MMDSFENDKSTVSEVERGGPAVSSSGELEVGQALGPGSKLDSKAEWPSAPD